MLNNVTIQGRLCAQPVLDKTPGGTSVLTCRLAVRRDFANKESGEAQTDFIPIVAWGPRAEFIARYFKKGQLILVSGRIQTRSWKDPDGTLRYMTEILVQNAYFCSGKKQESPGPESQENFDTLQMLDDDDDILPF